MEITLYGNDCPKCKVLKSKLEKENIEFEEKEDTEQLLSMGFSSYPVLEVDDEFMDFGQAYKWINDRSSKNGY